MNIEEIFSDLNYIKDFYVTKDKVYFSTDRNITYHNLYKDIKKYDCNVDKYKYIQLPFIPIDKSGDFSIEKLENIGYIASDTLDLLENSLKSNGIDSEISIEYINNESNIKEAFKKEENVVKNIKSQKKAIALNGDIEETEFKYKNLLELINNRKNSEENIVYIEKGGKETESYKQLYREAEKLALGLREHGLKEGDILIFQFPYNKSFIECFWACMMIGVIPAPMAVLDDYCEKNVNTDKLYNIWNMLDKPYIVSDDETKVELEKINNRLEGEEIKVISTGNLKIDKEFNNPYNWDKDECSLILFTSGSTGIPKGVTLSQKNMLSRSLGEIKLYNLDENNVSLNWMTLTHAAGLIWCHIRDMYLNILDIHVNSEVVLKNPLLWIELMSEYKVSITWAPNFAYALVNNFLDDSKDYKWDLSKLKYIFAGGEANVSKNLRNFLKRLKKYNLQSDAIRPTFGMTETSSCITYNNKFNLEDTSDEDKFIPVGEPMPGIEVMILDKNDNILSEGEIGRIVLKGKTITNGYINNEKANKSSFTDKGYFITGDLGFIENNYLTLTGREKDIIIINGLNYYVQDIESVVDDLEEVNSSYTVATSVTNKNGVEEILVFFSPKDETLLENENTEKLKSLVEKVKKQIREKSLLNPEYVIPMKAEKSVRTEIGKKQRSKYKDEFKSGMYNEILSRLSEDDGNNSKYILERTWYKKEILNNILINKEAFIINNNKEFEEELEKKNIKYLNIETLSDTKNINLLVDLRFFKKDLSLKEILKNIKELCYIESDIKIIIPLNYSIITENDNQFNNISMIQGIIASLCQEKTNLDIKIVDFDKINYKLLIKEMYNPSKDKTVVYRNEIRYVSGFKTSRKNGGYNEVIKKDSLVVVVGGLGGVGINICKWLLKKYNSKLLILGNSSIEKRKESYEELKNISENIIYVQTDVNNYDEVEKSIKDCEKVYDTKATCIFNLAGKISSKNNDISYYNDISLHTIKNETYDNFEDVINTKLIGTRNLVKIAKERNNIPLIVFSSVTGYFGGTSLGAYSGASSSQEFYCRYLINKGKNVYCVNWSRWKDIGLNKGDEMGAEASKSHGFNEISVEDGIFYLDYILNNEIRNSYVGINKKSLKIRYLVTDDYKFNLKLSISEEDNKDKIKNILKEYTSKVSKNIKWNIIKKNSILQTEELINIRNELINIWKENLKCSEIGLKDNIFDLGGNSLIIYKIVSNVKEKMNINLKPIDLLMNPNIEDLSYHICNKDSSNEVSNKKDKSKINEVRRIRRNRRRM